MLLNTYDFATFVLMYMYYTVGNVTILRRMQLSVDSDLDGDSPQFTLTCISTGGPATTVTWTRDSVPIDGGLTVLDNAITAQYTHTLTVSERLPGVYMCNVSNNKPSTATRDFTVQGNLRKHYHITINIYVEIILHYRTRSIMFPIGREWLVSFVFYKCCFTLQLPQLPLTLWQSRKVQWEFDSLGLHLLHWGLQEGTESSTVVVVVAMCRLIVLVQTTTY